MHTVESNKERTRKKEKYDHRLEESVTEEAVKQSSRKTGGEKAEKTKKI